MQCSYTEGGVGQTNAKHSFRPMKKHSVQNKRSQIDEGDSRNMRYSSKQIKNNYALDKAVKIKAAAEQRSGLSCPPLFIV